MASFIRRFLLPTAGALTILWAAFGPSDRVPAADEPPAINPFAPRSRQREVPLRVVKQIECHVKKEWMEKEWRFKELALDEKYYTGRSYPAREFLHTITLRDDRKISGPLSGIVYLKPGEYKPPEPGEYRPHVEAERYLLHKRQKGKINETLKSLHYTKLIKLGEEAFDEGKRKATRYRPERKPSGKRTGKRTGKREQARFQ